MFNKLVCYSIVSKYEFYICYIFKKRGLIIFLGFVILVAIFYVYTKSTQLSSTMKVAETVAETTVSDNQNSLFDLVIYRDMEGIPMEDLV